MALVVEIESEADGKVCIIKLRNGSSKLDQIILRPILKFLLLIELEKIRLILDNCSMTLSHSSKVGWSLNWEIV